MDTFFKGLNYMQELIHKKYGGKPIDRTLQKFLSTCLNGKKVSLEIFVEDKHALDLVLGVNRFLDEHKHLAKLDKTMESIVEHLDEHPEVTETESIKDILKICFVGYDNRTIEIEKDEINPYEASRICQKHNISSIANYKHHLFEAKDPESWKKYTPLFDERMVIYAKEGAEALALFKEISHYLGPIVAERKKYSQYASNTYKVNHWRGLHIRPSGAFVNEYVNEFAKKYPKADIWLRTDKKEASGNGIMGFVRLAAEDRTEITISCKPKEIADEFYKGLESFYYEGRPLFVKTKN